MKRSILNASAAILTVALAHTPVAAQNAKPALHINPRWHECSFQLDPSLTQAAWHQFTQEAGLVAYFRPLASARPIGRGHLEVSALQWQTSIDASDAAWNDTFVHPDSAHWLFEGDGLQFPGLMVTAGVSARTDVGIYFTKSPGANYGFYGAQLQQNLVSTSSGWDAAARTSFVNMYGPDDRKHVRSLAKKNGREDGDRNGAHGSGGRHHGHRPNGERVVQERDADAAPNPGRATPREIRPGRRRVRKRRHDEHHESQPCRL